MNPGKNKCEYLKEVRRRIATENDIPLEQRECTFKGECSGTCPFCEAEVSYLEKELHKRITLGKAVTVAGIALSSVMFSACGPNETLQGEPTLPPEQDTLVTFVDTFPQDTLSEETPPPPDFPDFLPLVGEIVEYSDVGFPPEYGTTTEWFENRIQDSVLSNLIREHVHNAEVVYTTDDEGFVDDVIFFRFPVDSTGKAIKRELETIIRNMPRWDTAKTTTRNHRFVINREK